MIRKIIDLVLIVLVFFLCFLLIKDWSIFTHIIIFLVSIVISCLCGTLTGLISSGYSEKSNNLKIIGISISLCINFLLFFLFHTYILLLAILPLIDLYTFFHNHYKQDYFERHEYFNDYYKHPILYIVFFVAISLICIICNDENITTYLGVICFIIMSLFFLFRGKPDYSQNPLYNSIQEKKRRKEALCKVKPFLAPYKNIMGNHTLSNKYCTIKFTNENKKNKFFCISKLYSKENNVLPFFEVIITNNSSEVFPTANEYFDTICNIFSKNTKLDDIYKIFSKNKNNYCNYILNDNSFMPFFKTK